MKNFYDKNKNTIFALILLIGTTFLMFYWISTIFDKKKAQLVSEIKIKQEKLSKIENLIQNLKYQKVNNQKKLNEGLLTFIEKLNKSSNLSNKMIALKPIENNLKEKVRVRYEKLTLKEILNLIKKVNSYANVNIYYLKMERNFENKEYANLILEIEKTS